MHQATVTITASLWKKILFEKAVKHTFWKYTKTYTIILLSAIAAVLTIYLIRKDKALLELMPWFCIFWFVIQFMTMTQVFLTIRTIKEDYRFNIDLNEIGIKILDERIPWEHYAFYLEKDHYLEIYNRNDQISYLPKTDELREIADYIKAHIIEQNKSS